MSDDKYNTNLIELFLKCTQPMMIHSRISQGLGKIEFQILFQERKFIYKAFKYH